MLSERRGPNIGALPVARAAVRRFAQQPRGGLGWAWARALLGLFFVIAAIWSFIDPIGTFVAIADALGFLLIFKGTLDLVTSIAGQGVNSVWWLGLIAGLLELFAGFWAARRYFPARASLLLLWIGFYALFRGISSIVWPFHLHSAS